MKKALIAGAASAVLAAMPVVGVFATAPTAKESLTDRFQFHIAHECTFTRVVESSNGGHPAGSWTAADGTSASGTDSDKIAITLNAGNTGNLGSSKFNVTCNGSDGYQVKAYVSNLTTGADTITAGSAPVSSSSSASSWTAQSSSTSGYVTATTSGTANTVASSSTPTVNAGQDFTMTYAVGLVDGQASGTYLGSIVYTLVDLTPAAEQ